MARSTLESELRALNPMGTEAAWLRHFLPNLPPSMDKLQFVSIYCDSQVAITIAKHKSYNCKSRQMELRRDVVS